MRCRFAVLALLLVVGACGSPEESDYSSSHELEDRREDALADARADLEGLSYQDQHGSYGCTDDCSGHDAGYEWAQQNDVQDASDCYGDSDSFIEGCEAYADDLQTSADDYADEYTDVPEREW